MDTPELRHLVVYTRDDGYVMARPEESSAVDAAVTLWVDSARTRDTLLYLDLMNGATYAVLASEITSWCESSPEIRARGRAYEAALKAESDAPWESE